MAKKKPKRKAVQDGAWREFSIFIRTRDAILTTGGIEEFRCISCGTIVPIKGNDAGHFVSGRHGGVLFVEEIVHGQCAKCNRFLEGNYIAYERGMRKLYGFKRTEELKLLKWEVKKYTIQELIDLKKHYRSATKALIWKWERGEFESQTRALRN